MSRLPYRLTPADRPRLGLIVLQADETIEGDFRRLLPPETALQVSRIPSGADLTPESIAQMALDLPAAAALFPRGAEYDVVGYGCTSGTTLIGAARAAELVRQGCGARAVCNPLDSALAAFGHLDVRRVGLVSPYGTDIAAALRATFEEQGVAVPEAMSFGEEVEANVARIDPVSIAAAAREIARRGTVDGIFLSCTNLRTLDVIEPLERELGCPVIGSNLALAWDMARAAGLRLCFEGPRLLREA
ncbi:maleate cis-trans isomerase family protein [Histidinibacterium aquaticum]|uniref:Asp/Glu racemase n=1 Tax=Histidinibacterium aquaticum TaxID=2613962 RepID=A0A5J5GGJ6_9RHOB|nr:aspartate/glutamate racemase family protein [Histidinibacterium aquaticum]KAA9006858.1 Asp/Glu racemase [Histidinibacterium aquaticum]